MFAAAHALLDCTLAYHSVLAADEPTECYFCDDHIDILINYNRYRTHAPRSKAQTNACRGAPARGTCVLGLGEFGLFQPTLR